MLIKADEANDFPAVFVHDRSVQRARKCAAEYALSWIKYQKLFGIRGCVVFDIDDTLIDGAGRVCHGFEFMVSLYTQVRKLFAVHIVTARPNCDHHHCMDMLYAKGIIVDPDRLHMLPTALYGKGNAHVERFKWKCHAECQALHDGVVAKFGDKMWDVAHLENKKKLAHVKESDCYIFFDPDMPETLSVKLPVYERIK